jgi:hypothetical protein
VLYAKIIASVHQPHHDIA